MKLIKELNIVVKYTTGAYNIEVPDDVYDQLMEDDEFDCNNPKHSDVIDWFSHNFCEDDATDWSYEIIDMEGED